nr:DUF397 domain-containing protein [Streptomyces sp.]
MEMALTPGTVHVWDSKQQAEAVLAFSEAQWAAFTVFARETSV